MKFSTWLATFNNGALDDDLTAALREVTEGVALEGKGGSVGLSLKLGQKADGVIVIADVSSKPPKGVRSQFFFARNGQLTTRHPDQPPIPGTEDPKEINNHA